MWIQVQKMKFERKKIIKYAMLLMTIAWCVLIFAMSAVHATQSDKVTRTEAGRLSSIFVKGYNDKNDQEQFDITANMNHLLRKAAHFAEYGFLGFLVAMDIFLWFAPGKTGLVISSTLLGTIYAVSDEVHQYFVPGRSCELKDVVIDSVGVLGGVIFGLILLGIIKRIADGRAAKMQTSDAKPVENP